MSAQIPTRRTRQATRSAVDENATRAARSTRSKTIATSGSTGQTGVTVSKAATNPAPHEHTASAVKRKREALGEVTNRNKTTRNGDAKPGTSDLKAAAVKKQAPSALTTVTGARIPLGERRTASGNLWSRQTRVTAATDNNVGDAPKVVDDAMVVDPAPARASKRTTTRVTASSTSGFRTQLGEPTNPSRRQIAPTIKNAPSITSRSRQIPSRRVLQSRDVAASILPPDNDVKPAHKKRRTSSVEGEVSPKDEAEQSDVQNQVTEDEKAGIVELDVEDERPPQSGSLWDDLDKEDAGDPLMVSEYVSEIFQYLLKLELTTMPNPRYMDTQAELAWRMRGILTDWLIQIHARFRLLPETLFLTINIIDRFLSARVVSLVKLQLVGITSLFIAAKYEEIMAPSVANFLCSADGNYGEKDILEAEKYILRTLDWNLSYPNPIHFLRRASKADNYDLAVRTVAKYFIEISCLEHRLLESTPSLIAAAGMWLARLVLDKDEWDANLVHYSGYEEEAIIPVARLMLNYVLKPTRHENFFKKYAARKFMKAAPFVHTWARERWPEGAAVNLADELPELRLASKARRDAGQAAGQLAEADGVLVR